MLSEAGTRAVSCISGGFKQSAHDDQRIVFNWSVQKLHFAAFKILENELSTKAARCSF
jgi:hypothetical protein